MMSNVADSAAAASSSTPDNIQQHRGATDPHQLATTTTTKSSSAAAAAANSANDDDDDDDRNGALTVDRRRSNRKSMMVPDAICATKTALDDEQQKPVTNGRCIRLMQTFWMSYVRCVDDVTKVKWLDLFIAEFNRLISGVNNAATTTTTTTTSATIDLSSDQYRFLENTASQLTCHLLHLVHEIVVNASINVDNADSQKPDAEDSPSVAREFANKRQRNVALCNADITTIVALREFLMFGVGGRILETLLIVDTTNMLCARELAGMLINLFPTSSWEAHAVPNVATKEDMRDLETQRSVLARIEAAFRMRPRRKGARRPNASQSRLNQTLTTDETKEKVLGTEHAGPLASAAVQTVQEPDYDDFATPEFLQLTGDYIGSLVLNLLHKLIREDNDSFALTNVAIGTGSVTSQCINFALDAYSTMAANDAFRPVNKAILTRRLLAIVSRGLCGIFSKPSSTKASVGLPDLASMLELIVTAARSQFDNVTLDDQCDEIEKDHRINLCLTMVLIVQRCVLRWTAAPEKMPSSISAHAESTVEMLHRLAATMDKHADFIVSNLLHIERDEGTADFTNCMNVLQRTIQSLRVTVQNISAPAPALHRRPSRSNIHAVRKPHSRQSLQIACGQRHQHHPASVVWIGDALILACTIERILLQLAERVTGAAHLRRIYRHFQQHVQCCCNTPLVAGLERLLRNACNTNTLAFGLQFLRNNVLRPMFGSHLASENVPCNNTCEHCDRRRLYFVSEGLFVGLYTGLTAHFETNCHDAMAATLPLLLRHLAKVAKYLPFDMACRVMAEVLLPQFRAQKATLARNCDSQIAHLSLCLTAFLCYLRDIRLIKAFFNDDNIQHLSDLITVPQLASLVCCLVRIGVDNATFLGENCGERLALAERLQQLQTAGVHIVTDALAVFFRAIGNEEELAGGDSGLKLVPMPDRRYSAGGVVESSSGERPANVFLERLEARELTASDLLKLAVVYWHQMLQILRRNPCVTADSLVVRLGDDGLLAMVQNTLLCFLYSRPVRIDRLADDFATLDLESADLTAESRFVWVSSQDDAAYASAPDPNCGVSRCPIYGATNGGADGDETIPICSSLPTAERERYNVNLSAACSSELIYDLRQAKCEKHAHVGPIVHSLLYSTFSESRASSVDLTRFAAFRSADDGEDDAARRQSSDSGTSDDATGANGGSIVHNVFQYISDNVWDMLFRANAVRAQAAEEAAERQKIEKTFGNAAERLQMVESAENKRLLLQLFEIACGVLMCDLVNETSSGPDDSDDDQPANGRPMASASGDAKTARPKALHHLKTILLRHAEHIHESAQNGASIVTALQALLRCAEMRYRCCMLDDCDHASFSQAPAAADALMSVTTKTLRNVGGNVCCATPTNMTTADADAATTTIGSLHSNSFDGGGGHGNVNGLTQMAENAASAAVFMATSGTAADSFSSDADETDSDEDDDNERDLVGAVRSQRNSTADSFTTADEGYDGDAEPAASLDSDNDPIDERNPHCESVETQPPQSPRALNGDPFPPTTLGGTAPMSRYRQHVVHADICRVVVDILIELSKRCLDDSEFWPSYLLPITQRLTAIRDSLGGSLFLLRGFAPILESDDPRSRDVQKAILGLITDINSADTLSAFLAIMANGERPPMDLLLARLFHLGSASLRLQPIAEFRFPVGSDALLRQPHKRRIDADQDAASTSGREAIIALHRIQKRQELRTALTRAAWIIPTDAIVFRPWSTTVGFSVSTWIKMQALPQSSGTASQSNEMPATSCDDKVHLLSVGSDRLLLSIYLQAHDSSAIFIQLSRPDSLSQATKPSSSNGRDTRHGMLDDETMRKRQEANGPTGTNNAIGLNVLSSTFQAFQNTRIAMRNSLSQFNLFVSSSATTDGSAATGSATLPNNKRDFKSLRYPLEVKGVRLQRNKWTHLAFSVLVTGDEMTIRITIDGYNQHDVHLPCLVDTAKADIFSLLCVGDTQPIQTTPRPPRTVHIEPTYSMANVLLFQHCITSMDILAMLTAYGPDATNFVPCATGNVMPNFAHLNATAPRAGNTSIVQHILRESLVLVHSAAGGGSFATGFIKTAGGSSAPGKHIAVLRNCSAEFAAPSSNQSLQTAVVLCGGISPLCYLFARVVELCPDAEQLQAATLAFVLRTVHSSATLYSEFCRLDGMRLLSPVIRSERCQRGVSLLGAILDISCDQTVLQRRSSSMPTSTNGAAEQLHVNHATTACILHAGLLVTVIRRYADWHCAQRPNGQVIESLLAALQALVREKHPRRGINQRRLREAGLMPALLHFCKHHLVGIASPVPFSVAAAQSLVGLISTFAGAPPAASLLDDIVKVLLLLHQPADSFITHDRSKFYFLVTAALIPRQRNRLSLPHLATTRRASNSGVVGAAGQANATERLRKSITPTRRASPARHSAAPTSPSPAAAAPTSPEAAASASLAAAPTSPAAAEPPPPTSPSGRVDLSAIADCSRSPRTNWTLHEADVVAVGQQRHGNGRHHRTAAGADAPAPGPNVTRRRLVVRRHTAHHRTSARARSSLGPKSATDDSSETAGDGVSESGFDERMSAVVKQYDIIAAADVAAATPPPGDTVSAASNPPAQEQRPLSASHPSQLESPSRPIKPRVAPLWLQPLQQQTQSRTALGVRTIQTGLFGLLRDFILILPDTTIREVLGHYVTVDIVLVLANHPDACVRAAIVRLLTVMCQRLDDTRLAKYQRAHSWLHAGNQIGLHAVDEELALACAQWVTGGVCLSIDQMIAQTDLRIADRIGLHALLAVLPASVGDLALMRQLLQLVERLYGSVATADQRQYMIDHGLVAVVAKCVQMFHQRWGDSKYDFARTFLQRIGQTVARLALRGFGSINVLWDLLNLLTFHEDTRNYYIVRGMRAYQADLLHVSVLAYVPAQRLMDTGGPKFSVSEVSLLTNDTSLSVSEQRTRFELIIDRVVQFATTAEPIHQPTMAELRLVQSVVKLTIAGLHRSAALTTWSLCPTRPRELKLYTAQTLHEHTVHAPAATLSLCADLKLLRCMLGALHATDYDTCEPHDQLVLRKLAGAIGLPTPNLVTNLSATLERLEVVRQAALRDRRPAVERSVHRHEAIVRPCIDAALRCTRAVVELQNAERRLLINAMRTCDDETSLATDWRRLIERMTHEGAPWHAVRSYPRSWRLDETEGPSRVRSRLRRCHLTVAPRFLMRSDNGTGPTAAGVDDKSRAPDSATPPMQPPLNYLHESLVQRPHFPLNDQVLYAFACSHLPVDVEHDGEMVVTESHLIFVPNEVACEPVRLTIADITEIWPRRHQHRDSGLEFCLSSRRTALFVFAEVTERDQLVRFFADKVMQWTDESKLVALTQHWSEGGLTNWEYLMALNQISGRTYQDLMQYPVMPWILADYTSDTLDLNNPSTFRRLDRPIAVQSESSEAHYIANYAYLEQVQQDLARSVQESSTSSNGDTSTQQSTRSDSTGAAGHMRPYHYGSHYSNSGTVLHYLVRVPPFTNYFLRYQDNSFDLPDRTFHALHTTWRLASRESPTDVKELIPEFFTLPEMLENFESFRFGKRQSGERVDNVTLPPWSAHSARLFVLVHRQALECDAVRAQLHRWIDLVFGWRQTGAAAVQAINVFHPATYIGFSAANVTDPVEKKALETMVRTYGQMPRQLFRQPHTAAIVPVREVPSPSASSPSALTSGSGTVAARVHGLRWGLFTGSPELTEPIIVRQFNANVHPTTDSHNYASLKHQPLLVALPNTNVCYALPIGYNLMQGAEPDTMQVIAWNEADGIVRIRPSPDSCARSANDVTMNLNSATHSGATPSYRSLLATNPADPITACGSDAAATQLWFGHSSGRLAVYRCGGGPDDFSGAGSGDKGGSSSQRRLNKSRYMQHSAPFTLSSYNSAFRKSAAHTAAPAATTGHDDAAANAMAASTQSHPMHGSSASANAAKCAPGRWPEPVVLIRHTDQITGIALCDAFRVCVSVARDGAACIWDANTLAYVRCIEPPSVCRAGTPIRLVAVSATMGDIVTVHALDDDGGRHDDDDDDDFVVDSYGNESTAADDRQHGGASSAFVAHATITTTTPVTDVGTEATEENDHHEAPAIVLDDNDDNDDDAAGPDFVRIAAPLVAGGRSMLRVHTINARYVGHIVEADRIECVTYSSMREGTGINVVAAGYADGTVRLWSSWDLQLVRELRRPADVLPMPMPMPATVVESPMVDAVGMMMATTVPVCSVAFTTYQHLVAWHADGVICVWQTDGLAGRTPQFPRLCSGSSESLQQQQSKRRSV